MLCSAMSFATMGAFAHGLRDRASWEVIAFARSVVVLVLSGGMLVLYRVKPRIWRPADLWARSIAGSLSMLCVFFSLTRLPVSVVVTLMNLAPIWVSAVTWVLLPKTRSKGVWVAVAAGIGGVVLVQQPQLEAGNMAVLAPVASSVLLAIVMLALHRSQGVDARAVVFHFALIAFLVSGAVLGYAATRRTPVFSTDAITVGMLLATGVAATSGQFFLTAAFASESPAKVSVVGLTQVGMAMVYDVSIWGHDFGLLSVLGTVLIVAPTGWVLYTERQTLVEE
ncbi:MAG: EamA/RhaT family transporter [Planctomycetes bacterium]|nr:EamA/RhaT family transporter [Planctomycetota bacterium]